MFSTRWETSRRQYGVVRERDVAIPVSAGFDIDCDLFRPDAPGRFPAILCFFPFDKAAQTEPRMPVGVCPQLVMCEGGDYNFYVRRGYAQVFANVRGTGRSGGVFDHLGDGTTQDVYDVIEWLARQPWCDGQVATFGTSYFAMTRFGLRIKCADHGEEARDFLDQHSLGHLWRPDRSQITIFHNDQYPSRLLVPITKGNRVGTFMSGGVLSETPRH